MAGRPSLIFVHPCLATAGRFRVVAAQARATPHLATFALYRTAA